MVYISMVRRGNHYGDQPCDLPIIAAYPISLGQLMWHDAHVHPGDPVWTVDTIGM